MTIVRKRKLLTASGEIMYVLAFYHSQVDLFYALPIGFSSAQFSEQMYQALTKVIETDDPLDDNLIDNAMLNYQFIPLPYSYTELFEAFGLKYVLYRLAQDHSVRVN